MTDPPTRLKAALADRYAIEKEIGSGGMATVYLAEDVRHHRKVAVKVLRPQLAAALGPERFIHEIEIAAQLTHPHIVPLHESGEADGFLYYVMPYIKGESLRERIARGRELPISDVVRILRDIVDALASAHKYGVVHRDIKPDNVLFAESHAVVTDFGVAKAVSQATGQQAITTAGVALGTPSYMAPEQATADPATDHRADIYAVGALAYEMLTGRPPFLGPTTQAVLAALLSEAPEPLTKRRTTVPPALEQVVMKCLEKNPADRWQSADELLPIIDGLVATSGGITPTSTMPVAAAKRSARNRPRVIMGAIAAAATVVLAAWGWLLRGVESTDDGFTADIRSVAVLPFTNTSGDEANESFTNGIHDDLLTQISKIADLKVISRTSVMEYKGTTKNMREIAEELGVAAVLEGGVQRAGNMVRINAQLIDARRDAHLWSEVYNRELSVENIFAIQSEIARQIASALRATLTSDEREQLAAAPTDNLEAYDFYLRGNNYLDRGRTRETLLNAVTMYEEAIALDPDFALAYASLSRAHSLLWWLFLDRTDERLARSKEAADEALRLQPDLAEGHAALGNYYYRLLDYEGALREYAIAEQLRPTDISVSEQIAYVHRRQGKMEEAARRLENAVERDPRSVALVSETGDTHARLRNVRAAERYYDRALSLAPDFHEAHYGKARRLRLRLQGDPDGARAVLRAAEAAGAQDPNLDQVWIWADLLDGAYDAALQRLGRTTNAAFETQHFFIPNEMYYAQIYELMGDENRARAYYDSTRVILESKLRETANDSRYHSSLGLAYAALGRKEDAIREGEEAVSLMPVSQEAMRGFYRVEDLARIYAIVGEHDRAVEQLDYLMSIPGDLGTAFLELDPAWASLHEHPGFRQLVSSN